MNIKIESSQEPLRGEETILLVDDEEAILDVTKELLEILGYKAIVANSGEEAIEIYKGKKDFIDLVILDMVMPRMSGAETFNVLKSINPEIKLILSSGYSLNGQAITLLNLGCRAFIQKPFSIKDISIKIRELLNNK